MPQDVMIWESKNGNTIHALKKSVLDVEERIENWIEKDISCLSYTLLIIGGQVTTVVCRIIDRAIHEPDWYIIFLMVHMPDTTICTLHVIQKRAGETVMLAFERSELFEQVEHEG